MRVTNCLLAGVIFCGLAVGPAKAQDEFPELPPNHLAMQKLVGIIQSGLLGQEHAPAFRNSRMREMAQLTVGAIRRYESEIALFSNTLTDEDARRLAFVRHWQLHIGPLRDIVTEHKSEFARFGIEPDGLVARLDVIAGWVAQDRFPELPPWHDDYVRLVSMFELHYPMPFFRPPFSSIPESAEMLIAGYVSHILDAESLVAEARLAPAGSRERVEANRYVRRIVSWREYIPGLREIIRKYDHMFTQSSLAVSELEEKLDLIDYRTRVIQFADYEGQQTPFPDVPEGHWAYEAVNNLKRLGILVGYPDGTFKGGS